MNTDMDSSPDVDEYLDDQDRVWFSDSQQFFARLAGHNLLKLDTKDWIKSLEGLRKTLLEPLSESWPQAIDFRDPIWIPDIELNPSWSDRLTPEMVAENLADYAGWFTVYAAKYAVLKEDPLEDQELLSLARKGSPRFLPHLMERQFVKELGSQVSHALRVMAWAKVMFLNSITAWQPPQASSDESESSLRPSSQPYGVSHEGAESLVRDWMAYMGISSATVTRLSGDGGIDVDSNEFVAQVKNYRDAVGAGPVRELLGVAIAEGKKPLFFTSGYFTSEAQAFAEKAQLPLFVYDAQNGTLECVNSSARELFESRKITSESEIDALFGMKIIESRYLTMALYGCLFSVKRVIANIVDNREDEILELKSAIENSECRELYIGDLLVSGLEGMDRRQLEDELKVSVTRFDQLFESAEKMLTLMGAELS